MTSFKDHFSGHAGIYRDARPTYPPALFAWLAQQTSGNALAWDCGCGSGQATYALAQHFARVVGTDPSANQIAAAERAANIEYRVEPAEHASLIGASANLITVAQALHWFDHARFYTEVKRVLAPGGVFAAWAYSDCSTGDVEIDRIKDTLYNDLTGPYWPAERAHVDHGYKTLPFPFVEIAAPAFPMIAHWTIEHLLAYFRSWSATQRYIKDKGDDPVTIVEPRLRAAWGDSEKIREIHWQFHLRCGKSS